MICSKCGADKEKDDIYCKRCGMLSDISTHKKIGSQKKEYWVISFYIFLICSILFIAMVENENIGFLLLLSVIITFFIFIISLFLEVFKNKNYYFLIPLLISLCGLVTGIIGVILLEEFEDSGFIYIAITAILLYILLPISAHIIKKKK